MVSMAFMCMFTDEMWVGASESDSFVTKQLILVFNKSLVFTLIVKCTFLSLQIAYSSTKLSN